MTAGGFPWYFSISPICRSAPKCVAATGQSARAAADQLGHTRPSMTQDRYYGRRAETNAAEVLAAFFEELY